jgi:hypothetical protein
LVNEKFKSVILCICHFHILIERMRRVPSNNDSAASPDISIIGSSCRDSNGIVASRNVRDSHVVRRLYLLDLLNIILYFSIGCIDERTQLR